MKRWAAVIAVVLTLSPAALGQESSFYRLLRPPLTREHLSTMAAMLKLDDSQQAAATALMDGYLPPFEKKSIALKELSVRTQKAANDKAPNARELRDRFIATWTEFVVMRADVEDELLADLHALLREEQETLWPPVVRMQRREGLPSTQAPRLTYWHRVNLTKIATETELSEPERLAIAATMDEYEILIDKPLAERADLWRKSRHWSQEKQDQESRAFEEIDMNIGLRLAALNRRYTRQLVTLVGPASGAAIDLKARSIAYSAVLGTPRPSIETTTDALRLEDLTEDQKSRIETIRTGYTRNSITIDRDGEAMLDGLDDAAEKFVQDEHRAEKPYPGEQATKQAWERRKLLEDDTTAAVLAVLNDSQRAKIAKPEE